MSLCTSYSTVCIPSAMCVHVLNTMPPPTPTPTQPKRGGVVRSCDGDNVKKKKKHERLLRD